MPVEGNNDIKYAGDCIRIYSEYCDTKDIDIIFSKIGELNNPDIYTKPYWHLGNWHFNAVRNNLKEYIDGKRIDKDESIADNHSRMYGNYFVIRLIFKTSDCVKVENLSHTYKYV